MMTLDRDAQKRKEKKGGGGLESMMWRGCLETSF